MKTLALDLASTTGFAITPQESGTWDLRPRRGDSPGMRYILLRQRLAEVTLGPEEQAGREQFAWAAGFFDGEGSISTSRAYANEYTKLDGTTSLHTSNVIQVQITQKDPEVLRRFQQIVGLGTIQGPYKDRRHEGKETGTWYAFKAGGVENTRLIISMLWPWLGSIKRAQAERVLTEKLAGMKRPPTLGSKWTVVYELQHHRGGASTEYAAGCVATIQEFCAKYGFQHTAVHSATLKKFATGRGNAKKHEMVEAARHKWPTVRIIDDNHADALHLLEYARLNIITTPPPAKPSLPT